MISSLNIFWYIITYSLKVRKIYVFGEKLRKLLTGITNARAVHAKAPVKFMNKPNLGITMAESPVPTTIMVLKTMLFKYRRLSPNKLGKALKHLLFSVISIAGITYIGNDPKRPRQYKS